MGVCKAELDCASDVVALRTDISPRIILIPAIINESEAAFFSRWLLLFCMVPVAKHDFYFLLFFTRLTFRPVLLSTRPFDRVELSCGQYILTNTSLNK